MQADEVDVLALLQHVNEFVELVLGDSELVFIKSGSYILVCMGIDIRIDSNGYIGLHTMDMGHLIDYIDLLKRLAVERLDAEFQRVIYFLVAFADSGIYYLVGWKTAVVCMKDFISTDAVCSEALAADVFQNPSFYICLNGIMYLDAIPFSHFCGVVDCLVQQHLVVVVERCGYFVQLFYSIDIQHFVLLGFVKSRLFWEIVSKTIAKIAKKSVISQIVCRMINI